MVINVLCFFIHICDIWNVFVSIRLIIKDCVLNHTRLASKILKSLWPLIWSTNILYFFKASWYLWEILESNSIQHTSVHIEPYPNCFLNSENLAYLYMVKKVFILICDIWKVFVSIRLNIKDFVMNPIRLVLKLWKVCHWIWSNGLNDSSSRLAALEHLFDSIW